VAGLNCGACAVTLTRDYLAPQVAPTEAMAETA
jgi:ferredoxin